MDEKSSAREGPEIPFQTDGCSSDLHEKTNL